MDVISIVMVLVVIGVALYAIETLVPMDGRIKRVIEAVVLLAVCIYLLQAVGILGGHPVTLK